LCSYCKPLLITSTFIHIPLTTVGRHSRGNGRGGFKRIGIEGTPLGRRFEGNEPYFLCSHKAMLASPGDGLDRVLRCRFLLANIVAASPGCIPYRTLKPRLLLSDI